MLHTFETKHYVELVEAERRACEASSQSFEHLETAKRSGRAAGAKTQKELRKLQTSQQQRHDAHYDRLSYEL